MPPQLIGRVGATGPIQIGTSFQPIRARFAAKLVFKLEQPVFESHRKGSAPGVLKALSRRS